MSARIHGSGQLRSGEHRPEDLLQLEIALHVGVQVEAGVALAGLDLQFGERRDDEKRIGNREPQQRRSRHRAVPPLHRKQLSSRPRIASVEDQPAVSGRRRDHAPPAGDGPDNGVSITDGDELGQRQCAVGDTALNRGRDEFHQLEFG